MSSTPPDTFLDILPPQTSLQTVWLQDVPLRSSPIPHDPRAVDDFPAVFQRALRALNVAPALNVLINTDVTMS
jgi:hypothetical protein